MIEDMNREIKFRAWNIHKKEWIDLNNYKLLYEDHSFTIIDILDDDFEYLYEEEDFILCQFTGLLDKNGKEIYEGDICRNYKVYSKPIVSVYWNEKYSSFYGGDMNLGLYEELEIIGNIYEHPNLLKQ